MIGYLPGVPTVLDWDCGASPSSPVPSRSRPCSWSFRTRVENSWGAGSGSTASTSPTWRPTVGFYEALGLECTSRTRIDTAGEAIVETVGKGGKVQFAQQDDRDGPLDMGNAFWKLYVNTNDIGATHVAALAAGAEEVMAPMRMEQWPTSVSFVKDRDGYLVEFVERVPLARRGRHHAVGGPRSVLHQRHGPRGHDRLLRDAGPGRAPAAPTSPEPKRRSSRTPTRGARSSWPSRRTRMAPSPWGRPSGSST